MIYFTQYYYLNENFSFFSGKILFSLGKLSCVYLVKKRLSSWDLSGCPVVENPPSSAGDMGSTPGRGAKIPCATGQLSPCATTREKPASHSERSCKPQLRPDAAKNK